MKAALLEELQRLRRQRRAVVLATDLGTGEQWLLDPSAPNSPEGLPDAVHEWALDASSTDRSRIEADGAQEIFLNVFQPPLRLLLVGAVHIAQPLAAMAYLVGFDVTVIDPRSAFSTMERFPSVEISRAWPDEAIDGLAPDARTAIVTLTHDPKLDDPALAAALRSPAFYIGSLGSRKTHAARVARLEAEGFSPEDISRIHGPLGLPLGGRAPGEIAVSALAQILQRLRLG